MNILTIVLSLLLAGTVPAGSAVHISNNYWGSGVVPSTTSNGLCTEAESNIPSGVTCPTVPVATKIKPHSKVGTLSLSDPSMCDSLYSKIFHWSEQNAWQGVYDSGMAYIDTCSNYNIGNDVYIFQQLGGAVEQLSHNDTGLFVTYRKWLESVLYLNTKDPQYYCSCVYQISGTFGSYSDTTETLSWKALNRTLAVLQWLLNNGLCDTSYLKGQILAARGSQYEDWLNDTLVPLDTTLPPLDSIQPGLLELLEKHFLYASVPENYVGILSNASTYPNPTGSGTVISFGISQEAYVKIEVFDVLGNLVSGAGFESLFEPGNKAVPISLQGLPSGTYFARIETAYGEAQTVKVVKQ